LASIATVTAAINVCGVGRPQPDIARRAQARFTRNKQQHKDSAMEIIFFLVIVFIGLVLRSNFQNISWHSSEIDDLERRLKILEQRLEEKIATKSDLYALEQKLSKPIDSFNPDLNTP
jgi:hypothetical protein